MAPSILKTKSYDFATRIVNLYKIIIAEKKEFVLSKQLLRSGTAIGALVAEADYAQSKKDFISKLSISLKEAHETEYWLTLLKDTGYIEVNIFTELSDGLTELLKMLVSSIKTAKEIQNN